jgi:hypothetical protein
MAELACEFRQRLQHEAPFMHARMWNLECRRSYYKRSVQDYVDVDNSWSFRRYSPSPHLQFDLLHPVKQPHRKQGGLSFHDNI